MGSFTVNLKEHLIVIFVIQQPINTEYSKIKFSYCFFSKYDYITVKVAMVMTERQ